MPLAPELTEHQKLAVLRHAELHASIKIPMKRTFGSLQTSLNAWIMFLEQP